MRGSLFFRVEFQNECNDKEKKRSFFFVSLSWVFFFLGFFKTSNVQDSVTQQEETLWRKDSVNKRKDGKRLQCTRR